MSRKVIVWTAVLIFIGAAVYFCSVTFPIVTSYSAKVVCSSVFLSERAEKDIAAQDLNFFPANLVRCSVNRSDSTASCSIFGFARRKALYRAGMGATLLNGITKESLVARPRIRRSAAGVADAGFGNVSGEVKVDSLMVVRAAAKFLAGNDPRSDNFTRALLVVCDGRVLVEFYSAGITKNTPLIGWSMTKSLIGCLAGILVGDDRLNIDLPADVPQWKGKDDTRGAITVKQLLQQTSGLAFDEVYHRRSDATKMLFLEYDAGGYAARRPLAVAPGTRFQYSSGNTNILSGIFRRVLGDSAYQQFSYERLFKKIGMNTAVMEQDASGAFVASSFCYACARDWAKLGVLYLNDGVYNGVRILPAGWVKESTQPSSAATRGEYGFQWWLNAGEKGNSQNRLYPQLPADMYFADGYEGQNIFVIPSKKLVVVRLGVTRGSQWGENSFLPELLQGISVPEGTNK